MKLTTPSLFTERLVLRPFTESDLDNIYSLQSNAEVLRYWDGPPWADRSQAIRFLATCRRMEEEGTGTRLVIEERTGTFHGWCCLQGFNPVFRTISLGYCLEKAAWGRGFATEAVQVMVTWAYETLDLNRVEAGVDTRNPPSARVLEKLGFVLEGTQREDCVVNGDVSDSWIYGLLRSDWERTLNHGE